MNRIIPLSFLFLFVYLLGRYSPAAGIPAGAESSLALGFIILAAYMAGEIFSKLKLPKITGYMFIGMVSGPQILGFVSEEVVGNLKIIDSIALGLIAFSAGREMKLKSLRGFSRSIISISFFVSLLESLGIGLLVWYSLRLLVTVTTE